MYSVDKIENGIVVLIKYEDGSISYVDSNLISGACEGDIVDIINDNYVINKDKTKIEYDNIRKLFDSLKGE